MFKLGCCVHLMAVQDSLGLPFDGAAAPTRRVFADKRRKKKHGRPTEVGHALSLS
ncbi:hypothetical protein PF005_g21502 [Phytophthora fragariae]|uniref:Uncharacterized protein n=1 Tax=Phytophthora fragariae TaxID=53985 RepID=A0A6A3IVK0_9STRA|nr:hypothetical protein PF003_g27869 [Phytophthora fragariae]KAE8927327.1 hypothetical protein PF009_g22509 [Phytophthora fragariae]KAE8985812.1 hypothetical protein PF011_g20243 [Phytophthora fragariae]KAE9084547.1 hypothetical protein PF007_g21482 [Phytophthora fragariae]KAE9084698.1 hypothetical protein PF010_g20733 [Phytophthora fragariae]